MEYATPASRPGIERILSDLSLPSLRFSRGQPIIVFHSDDHDDAATVLFDDHLFGTIPPC